MKIQVTEDINGMKYVRMSDEDNNTETWNGIHAQITAPKGTFEKIFNDAEEEGTEI